MRQKARLFRPIIVILCTAIVFICGIVYIYDSRLFVAVSFVALGAFAALLLSFLRINKDIEDYIKSVSSAIGECQNEALIHFLMPVIITDAKGEILWYNDTCQQNMVGADTLYGKNLSAVLGQDLLSDENQITANINYSQREYTVYGIRNMGDEKKDVWMYYFADDTALKQDAREYQLSRPAVLMITVDSYEEVMQNSKENERSQLLSQVEYYIEKFAGECGGIVVKNDRDRYMAIVEERYMSQIIAKRFEILDQVRTLSVGERAGVTLSIGVGRLGNSFNECELAARQSLDMALGRGGDQAAVKTANGYDFYGGMSKGVEKRTKVKTRIVATAMVELIESSSNVIIMGHKFADLDSFGSAVGLLTVIRQMGKIAHIAISRSSNLVSPLLERLEQNGYDGAFLDPELFGNKIDSRTLLIIVDTHLVHVLESSDLYRACQNVIVIDHHRRMVGHVDNAVIFYHEPYASSTSEMVSELIQYFGDKNRVGRLEAEALLAGIMLDTKNFTIKTGVRTFEAAAFLRRQGADTVEVKKLFSSSMHSYQDRVRLVASAEVYKRCAIVATDEPIEEIKIVAPQAADELLMITDVDASFVMYEYNKGVSLSARSLGKMNVQMVMETLGGGGHQTMAGAQIENITIDAARTLLIEAIDKYNESNGK